MPKFLPGDTVSINHSPYSSVPVGTVTKVERVRVGHFKRKFKPPIDLYDLANLPHKLFWPNELEKASG